MRREHTGYIVCPRCKGDLCISDIFRESSEGIEKGALECALCGKKYDIVDSIPRFVPLDNYSKSFGYEWKMHARTQYDSYTGLPVSEKRFFGESGWPRQLLGETILEVGSGSGRFTEQAASTGAMVVSLDYSLAVEANYSSNGSRKNVLIIQADIYHMPLRQDFFDKIFCFGVLQHTPRVKEAFMLLPVYLKNGGNLAVDIYRKYKGIKRLLITKYWVRPLTRAIPSKHLYGLCKKYIDIMWPVSGLLGRIPSIGRALNWKLLVSDYRGAYVLPEKILKEWAVLDTFDMVSPMYDSPQYIEAIEGWFRESRMEDVQIYYDNGIIVGRARKPRKG